MARAKGTFTTNALWLAAWIVVAIAASTALRRFQIHRGREFQTGSIARTQASKSESENKLNALEQDLKARGREAAARRESELNKALGGPVAAAFKNPAYSIREALLHAAEACAPTNTYAHAEANRFTEFTVTIDSSEGLSTNQMIAIARAFVPLAKEYLNSLQFSARGKLIAEIDRQDIEFIEDWSRAADQRIAMLLPRETESRMDPGAIERFKAEQQISEALSAEPALRDKTERLDRNFRQAVQNAYGELTQALEALQKSMALSDARTLRDLDLCGKQLHLAIELANRAQAFWTDPVKEWQRLLEAEGVSPDWRDALVKSFSGIFRNDPAKTAKVFDTLKNATESSRYALGLLENESDKWKFSSNGIGITDEEFARKFERAQRQWREDMRATDDALRAWHETTAP
jgi:hypothetical protein